MLNKLPNAKRVFRDFENPMTPEVVSLGQKGFYAWQVSKGISISGNHIWAVKVRGRLGIYDEFCSKYSKTFKSYHEVILQVSVIKDAAWNHYKELKKRSLEREEV